MNALASEFGAGKGAVGPDDLAAPVAVVFDEERPRAMKPPMGRGRKAMVVRAQEAELARRHRPATAASFVMTGAAMRASFRSAAPLTL
jgi:hypothetical protein